MHPSRICDNLYNSYKTTPQHHRTRASFYSCHLLNMTDPLKKWDQLEERRSTSKKPSASNVWVWEDKYIVEDFNTLQAPEVDLTTKINNLKAFYMCYFGEITSTSNLGGLFVQLMATTPELSSDKGENLFKFSTDGKRKLSGYVAPKDLQGALSRFLDTATKRLTNLRSSQRSRPP